MKNCHYYNKKEVIHIDKKLMSLKEVCEYTGWWQTKVRQILNKPDSQFTIRLGNCNHKNIDDILVEYTNITEEEKEILFNKIIL